MNTSAIMNVIIVYRRKCYVNISMNTLLRVNVTTMQRCKRCTFDSPGLASESEVYPGAFAVSGNNAVGVVPFIPRHFIAAFHAENVQHLRRWISLQILTRGRLVPRQPRAIKGTTRTELRGETIVGVAWLIIKGEIVKGKQSLTPSPSPKREGSN